VDVAAVVAGCEHERGRYEGTGQSAPRSPMSPKEGEGEM
jgi:hypothetical protein